MKNQLCNTILALTLLFNCSNNQELDGNYFTCNDGEYTEIYFKNDSMRIASNNIWVKLSEWRKVKIKNDTLHFETFGEWRDSSKAEIKYLNNKKIRLYFFQISDSSILNPIGETIKFNETDKFWESFNNRQNLKDCK